MSEKSKGKSTYSGKSYDVDILAGNTLIISYPNALCDGYRILQAYTSDFGMRVCLWVQSPQSPKVVSQFVDRSDDMAFLSG